MHSIVFQLFCVQDSRNSNAPLLPPSPPVVASPPPEKSVFLCIFNATIQPGGSCSLNAMGPYGKEPRPASEIPMHIKINANRLGPPAAFLYLLSQIKLNIHFHFPLISLMNFITESHVTYLLAFITESHVTYLLA